MRDVPLAAAPAPPAGRWLLAAALTFGVAFAGAPAAFAATSADEQPVDAVEADAEESEAGPAGGTAAMTDSSEDLDPGGEPITVSGYGYTPGTTVSVETWAMTPEEAAEAEDASAAAPEELPGIADSGNAVTVEVAEQGVFSAELLATPEFAEEAGLGPNDGAFEVRVSQLHGSDSDAAAAWAASGSTSRLPVTFAAPAATPPEPAPETAQQADTGRAPQAAPATPDTTEGSGGQELTVSKTTGLDPDGETVTVTGSGYDTTKGIYVALCDISNASSSQAPGPCLGGVDMEGDSGFSMWISSNPPPYGEGLAEPYDGSGSNGSFSVQLRVQAQDDFTDCLDSGTECAVVTRNDHTRTGDRSQDVFVPATFAGQDGGGSGGSGGGSGGDGNSGGAGGTGSGSGGGSGSGSSGGGSLPRTGAAIAGLVITAVVACVAGASAMLAARRRGSPAAS